MLQKTGLEKFRRGKFTEEKIEQITSIQELDIQLATYIAEMKQKNGKQYLQVLSVVQLLLYIDILSKIL